jgi:hypothetical protein
MLTKIIDTKTGFQKTHWGKFAHFSLIGKFMVI